MVIHIYHRTPSAAWVDDASLPVMTLLGRRPKGAAPISIPLSTQDEELQILWQKFKATGEGIYRTREFKLINRQIF